MLLVQYGLGVWVTFEGSVPSADHGAGFWGGFIDAITQGPLALSLHALVGTLLIVSAVSLMVRAIWLAHIAVVTPHQHRPW
ncbi:MAG: hypothetical protein JF886_02365 [Candidatus Dormibacteraeota bacterium]|uniref:Uncharacterized protein n=1 Tax=Candidatus Aeolococcus gillhamiae TaxID=3127015 RepID=A0A934JV40_9BACT|nr:hypothetical protein [Candidatus Dormibacteraeota bacterium]